MPRRQDSHADDTQFEQALKQAEQNLLALKERYTQIKRDRERKQELELRKRQLESDSQAPAAKTQLKEIEQELETIELNLESTLLNWSSFKEPFWLAVRFGGLGVVIGWLLKSLAGS